MPLMIGKDVLYFNVLSLIVINHVKQHVSR